MKTENTSIYDISTDASDLDEFREMVAKNAYYRAKKRNFECGFELEDWLEAEREISKQRRYWRR